MSKTSLAHGTAYLCAIALLLAVITPLAGLAFHRPPPEPDPPPAADEAPPAYHLLTGLVRTSPAGPLYDTMTYDRRRRDNLPTSLPAALPYYGRRTVYLTFDDGPDPDITPAVLRILHREGIPATFFLVGLQAEKNPSVVRKIYDSGHAIGNHSYNHVYRDLYHSPEAYTAQLRRTDNILIDILGVRPRISRAPGGSAGSFTAAYWKALDTHGYIEVGWNISSGDASRAKADAIAAAVADQAEARPYLWSHAIVLMHDGRGHEETVRALPKIIKFFKDRGFEFRVVGPETPPAW